VRLQSDLANINSVFDIDPATTGTSAKGMAHRTTGKIDGGGPDIYLKSVWGKISLEKKAK
jgi:hypothetical protein